MSLHVGQKVVCVRGNWHVTDEVAPRIGKIYTIREIVVADDGPDAGEVFQLLVEVVNRPGWYTNGLHEISFWSKGFRPLVEQKTDISVFKALLTPAKQTEDA